jgi:hypothetical protein
VEELWKIAKEPDVLLKHLSGQAWAGMSVADSKRLLAKPFRDWRHL